MAEQNSENKVNIKKDDFQDVGTKIFGARKDNYAYRRDELGELRPLELEDLAQKSKIWNNQELKKIHEINNQDKEFQPFYLLCKKIIRDAFPTKLKYLNPYLKEDKANYAKERAILYIDFISRIKELMDGGREGFLENGAGVVLDYIENFKESEHNDLLNERQEVFSKSAMFRIQPLAISKHSYEDDNSVLKYVNEEHIKNDLKEYSNAFIGLIGDKRSALSENALTYILNYDKLLSKAISLIRKQAIQKGDFDYNGKNIPSIEIIKKLDSFDFEFRKTHKSNKQYHKAIFDYEKELYEFFEKEGLKDELFNMLKVMLSSNYKLKLENKVKIETNSTNEEENNNLTNLGAVEGLEGLEKQTIKQVKEEIKKIEKKFLGDIERKGFNWLNKEEKALPENLLAEFNLKWVEFGNALSTKQKEEFARQGYNAFKDLAYLLDIPVDKIGLKTEQNPEGLGIGFATRGVAKANAHYEQIGNIINLTKLRGAGSLAHEYGHALNGAFTNQALIKELNYKLKDITEDEMNKYIAPFVYINENKDLDPVEVAVYKQSFFEDKIKRTIICNAGFNKDLSAFDFFKRMRNIKNSMEQTIEEHLAKAHNIFKEKEVPDFSLEKILEHPQNLKNYIEGLPLQVVYGKNYFKNYFIECCKENFPEIRNFSKVNEINFLRNFEIIADEYVKYLVLEKSIENNFKIPFSESYLTTNKSGKKPYTDFYLQSLKLDDLLGGKKIYYSQPCELFARAFESYIEQKMIEKGVSNDFLVLGNKTQKTFSYADFDIMKCEMQIKQLNFYPNQEEMRVFYPVFEKLLNEKFERKIYNDKELEAEGYIKVNEKEEGLKNTRKNKTAILTEEEKALKDTLILNVKNAKTDIEVQKTQETIKEEIKNEQIETKKDDLKKDLDKEMEKGSKKSKGKSENLRVNQQLKFDF